MIRYQAARVCSISHSVLFVKLRVQLDFKLWLLLTLATVAIPQCIVVGQPSRLRRQLDLFGYGNYWVLL